jgi:nanoRNase/pAp phosphatase (c-di-AMP/oligoRNAs hydrolase)
MVAQRTTRSDRFLKALSAYEQIFVVTHDNPDPDAIATGWAVYCLIREKLTPNVRLLGGGEIMRAENRQLVKLLRPPLELLSAAEFPAGTGMVLVDCSAQSQNHLFNEASIVPAAVIDHHLVGRRAVRAAFEDVRPEAAASATIAASYMRQQKLKPSPELATAVVYAVRTETRGNAVHYTRFDRQVMLWIGEHMDPAALAEIENAPLSPAYFGDMALALQGTFIYGDTALCLLPRASGPEIVGEVADLLIRCEGIRRVLCGAVVHEELLLAVRTECTSDEDAAELVCRTLAGLGHGGGHKHRAGGKISAAGRGPLVLDMLQDELLSRWLVTCGIDRQRGAHLIPRREIVANL